MPRVIVKLLISASSGVYVLQYVHFGVRRCFKKQIRSSSRFHADTSVSRRVCEYRSCMFTCSRGAVVHGVPLVSNAIEGGAGPILMKNVFVERRGRCSGLLERTDWSEGPPKKTVGRIRECFRATIYVAYHILLFLIGAVLCTRASFV